MNRFDYNISAKYQPNYAFYGSKSKFAHYELKTILVLEIKDLALMSRSIRQRASLFSDSKK